MGTRTKTVPAGAGRASSADKSRPSGPAWQTVAERTAAGKAARGATPLDSHGIWKAAGNRPDPVGILEAQAQSRVPELVPIRYGRMLVSPFTYYRGAAAVMASDLATTPRSGFDAQISGDAHLSNFGGFASADRALVFDANDFDETLPGPWEWDVKRLVASFAVAARDRGIDRARDRRPIVLAVARAYREAMRAFAAMTNTEVWYSRLDVDEVRQRFSGQLDKDSRKRLDKNLAKARTKDSVRGLAKLTKTVDGELRFISDPPLIVPIHELVQAGDEERLRRQLNKIFVDYHETLSEDRRVLVESYRLIHLARKVVGVGSVGTRAWVALLIGRDESDPLLLQIKEAEASVLEPYLGPSRHSNHGQRVVEGQRLMQASSDIFLGWHRSQGIDGVTRDFYVRQLWDWKVSAEVEVMTPDNLQTYAKMCGWTLARGHARSGDRVAIAAYLGGRDRADQAFASFAEDYADQNEDDYRTLQQAARDGRVQAVTGV
jgi:uncharacterized protein (DUF2252 family)